MNKLQYKKLLQLRKSEETMFYHLLTVYCKKDNQLKAPRQLIREMPINYKRAWYLLAKFKDYNYGVALDMGWIE